MSSKDDPWRGSAPVPGTGWGHGGDPAGLPDGEHAFSTPEHARHREDRLLGEGGMGRVVASWDARLRRTVAVKLAAPGSAAEARLAQEAWITSQLEHPGVVPIYDAGITEDGRRFVVMRVIRGRSLRELLTDAPAPRLDLLPVLRKVAEAVAYAHAAGIVHRDLTPSNVLVGAFGEVQVADWGLARPTSDGVGKSWGQEVLPAEDQARTVAGVVLGTPGYMSPEQAVGAPVDPRADVWALGALLYEALTSVPPFGQLDPEARQRAIATLDVPDPRELQARCPASLATLALASLSRDPEDRPANAQAFLDRLEEPSVSQPQRPPWTAGVLGLLAGAVAVGGLWSMEQPPPDLRAQLWASQAVQGLRAHAEAPAEVLAAASLTIADEPVVRGMLMGLRAGARPELVDSAPAPERCAYAAMTRDTDRYACAEGTDVALFSADGTRLWHRSLGEVARSVFISADAVMVQHPDANITALSLEDGRPHGSGSTMVELFYTGDDGEVVWGMGRWGIERVDRPSLDEGRRIESGPVPRDKATSLVTLPDDGILAQNGGQVWLRRDGAWTALGALPVDFTHDAVRWARGLEDGRVLWVTWQGLVITWVPGTPLDEVEVLDLGLRPVDVALSPGGDRVAALDQSGTVTVMDRGLAQAWVRLPAPRGRAVRFDDTGDLRVVGREVSTWRLPDAAWPSLLDTPNSVVSVDVNGPRLALAGSSRAAVYQQGQGLLWRRAVGPKTMKAAVLDDDGDRVAVAGWGISGFEVHDLTTGERRAWQQASRPGPLRRLDWIDGERLAGISYERTAPLVVDSRSMRADMDYTLVGVRLMELAVRRDAGLAFGISVDGRLVRMPISEPATESVGQAPSGAHTLAVCGDGAPWAVVEDQLVQLEPSAAAVVASVPVGPKVSAVHCTASGGLAVGYVDGRLRVWSTDGALKAEVQAHDDRVAGFDEEGGMLVTASWDGRIRWWALDALDTPADELLQDARETWGIGVVQAQGILP